MSCLPKPVLRGHIQRKGLKIIIGAITFGVINGGLYRFLVSVPRKKAYEDFLKSYNPEAHYEEMVRYGYLQSANKGDE